MLKLALAFAAAGFPVFPVDVFFDDERKRWRKVPCIREWEARATISTFQIIVWWSKWPCAMPGIPPGRCGKVVVDADRHGGSDGVALFHELDRARGPFPAHPFNYTKSGGEHHWFCQPASAVRYAKWGGGEVLGHGRFVVGYEVPQGECPVLPEMFCRASIAEDTRTITHTHVPSVVIVGAKEIPKPLYNELLRLMPLSDKVTRHDHRRVRGILWIVTSKRQGEHRNEALLNASSIFRELIYTDVAPREVAERLLFLAAEACGYVAKDGAAQAMATIRSGLGSAGLPATDGTWWL
jgi:hypothetical protein